MHSQQKYIPARSATSNGMKLLYLANIRLPTEKAHGIQIMSMMRAFVQSMNIKSVLVTPRRFNLIKKDPFSYYGFDEVFDIIRLPVVDFMFIPLFRPLWFWIENATFSIVAAIYAIFEKETIFYTRDFLTVLVFSLCRKGIFYEIHTMPERVRFFHVFVWKRSAGLVVISNGIKKELMRFDISEKKILIAPDAVDLSRFSLAVSKEEARRVLGLPREKKIVLYAGHLYAWKGASTLIDAAKQLDENTVVYFVGGTEEDVSKYKTQNTKYKNIIFVGHKPHQEIPLWLRAADILVLPTSGKEKIGREYTSPMKLFEYMASGTPIVAANTPAIREILDETTAVFFEADNSHDLAGKICFYFSRGTLVKDIADSAARAVKKHSWGERAKHIMNFARNISEENRMVRGNKEQYMRAKNPEAIIFARADLLRTLVIGETIALLSIPILNNLKVFAVLARYNGGFLSFFIIVWLMLLPLAAVAGLYCFYFAAIRWRASFFQLGKYGLIGLLNTFLSAGILNFFIWITDIARGWQVIAFTVIAFAITITHSFFWNKFWTFQAHGTNNGKTEYLKFFMVTGATSLLNISLLHIMVNVIGAPAGMDPKIWVNIVLAIEIPVAFLGNFFGYKMFVFKSHKAFIAGMDHPQ